VDRLRNGAEEGGRKVKACEARSIPVGATIIFSPTYSSKVVDKDPGGGVCTEAGGHYRSGCVLTWDDYAYGFLRGQDRVG